MANKNTLKKNRQRIRKFGSLAAYYVYRKRVQRERDPEGYKSKIAARKRRYEKSHRAKVNEVVKLKRKLHPLKYRARDKVHRAVRRGRLQRLPCTVCGDVGSQAHHPDYTKPLEVVWLCHTHHMKQHPECMPK